MITTALAAILLGQTYRGVRISLPVEHYWKPTVGFMREIAVGVSPRGRLRYNLYKYSVVRRANVGNHPVVDYVDERVGDIDWSVQESSIRGTPAYMLAAGGSVRQVLDVPRSKEKPTWTNVARRWFWVSPKGRLLRDNYQLSTPGGAWTMDATFGENTVEITLNAPSETRNEELSPKDGLKGFDLMFEPMLTKGKVLLQEKRFHLLDPFSGAPKSYTARIVGRFSSNTGAARGKGHVVEVKGPGMDQRVFIRDDDELLKVELPNDRWIQGIPLDIMP